MSKLVPAASAAVLALGLAACGSSSSSSHHKAASSAKTPASTSAGATPVASGGGHSLAISAAKSGQLMFSTKTLHASAGKVTIAFTNDAPEAHNFTLATASGTVLAKTPQFDNATKTLSVDLKAGTYTYYCDVPGHEAAGMKGTLTVS